MGESISIGPHRLYHADCLEVLPTLEAGSVDAVVTDPPFGIDWSRATWEDSAEKYPEFMRCVVQESNRLVLNGWCFFFQSMKNAPRWHEWFPADFRLFAACKNFAQIRPTGIWHSWDPAVFWKNGSASWNRNARKVIKRDYHVGNVAGVFGRDNIQHPSPRPLGTMEHIVAVASLQNAVVCDPFMGSGTTGVACVNLGRRFVGIELERKYFDIACERIERAEKMAKRRFFHKDGTIVRRGPK